MAKFNGDVILVNHTGTRIAHSTSATLNIEQELLDSTTKDSSRWKEHVRGDRSWSIDVEALVDYSATQGFETLFDNINGGTSFTARFNSTTSGDLYFEGTVDPSGLSMDAPHNGVVTFSGTLQGTGSLTKGTVA